MPPSLEDFSDGCGVKFGKLVIYPYICIIMKNKFLIWCIILPFIGCEVDHSGPTAERVITLNSPSTDRSSQSLSVYVIDSCEYIGSTSLIQNHSVLTHKGNCKFCAARNKHR